MFVLAALGNIVLLEGSFSRKVVAASTVQHRFHMSAKLYVC